MITLEKYLLSNGWKLLRKVYDKKAKAFNYEAVDNHSFSTMGDICYFYTKKGWEDICIGLHEVGKPPTLIHPRPRLNITINGRGLNESTDDGMNVALQVFDSETILKAIKNNETLTYEKSN